MTTITHTSNGSGEYYRIKGHAGYNPGNDVVCAGLSTITYGLINYLEEKELKHEIADLRVKEEPGDIQIGFTLFNFPGYEHISEFVMLCYQMMSENYPNNVFIGGSH